MGKMGGESTGAGRKSYSVRKEDYKLLEEVGYGSSATVHRAIFLPLNEVVAVKCLDLERCNSNLDDIRREAQTMSLIDHPNLISAFCSFDVDHYLWVIMPFMAEGSCFHLMKIAYPDGFEEPIICSVLKEALKGLEYLHRHGHIHRDVKAGNVLLDSSGIVKLGDFGVSACMFDKGNRQRARNTFVGTPCWMAPEVLQPGSGYDFKADIWSFGITALELAHGHAPFSKYPPMKVLLMTIQNAPPGLDYDRDKRFSKSFKEMVAMCLVKDQTKRPTAEKLLKHAFFKSAKSPEVTVKNLLADLPPLWDRVKALHLKDAAQLAMRQMPSAEQEALSQSEYKRGVSAWNFNIEDLKSQASMIQEDEDLPVMKEEDQTLRLLVTEKDPSMSRIATGKSILKENVDCRSDVNGAEMPEARLRAKNEIVEVNSSNPSSQGKPDAYDLGRLKNDSNSVSKMDPESNQLKSDSVRKSQAHSGIVVPGNVLTNSSSDKGGISDRFDSENIVAAEKHKRDIRKAPNFSGPLMLPNRASANSLSAPTAPVRSSGGYRDSLEEKGKVQIKGRFSVTSENVDLVKDIPICTVPRRSSQGSPLRKSASVGDWLDPKQVPISQSVKDIGKLPASILVPHLQNLFQQTSFQRDLIMSLLNRLQQTEQADALHTGTSSLVVNAEDELLVETAALEREQQLLMKISEMQARVSNLTDELIAAKVKHAQLQQQLNAAYSQEEEDRRRREEKES